MDWIDVIAVDPDGSVWAFEGDAYFDKNLDEWQPVDDGDGLRYSKIGEIEPVYDLAPTLIFEKAGIAKLTALPQSPVSPSQ